jgi:2,3-diketo-5-methylthio-1-phosphopentane phosphatase
MNRPTDKPRLSLFCDFDGTISRRDVGYHLFRRFSGGRTEELVAQWQAGEIDTRSCLVAEAGMCKATPSEIHAFLDQIELDRGFAEFVALCESNRVDLTILSEGLDFYINHILKRYGLQHLTVSANHGYLEDNTVKVKFLRENKTCQRCGSCKGERIREYRESQTEDVMAVFVGDGLSDICAMNEADLVFAKKDLEQHCRMNNIDYVSYDYFDDVTGNLIERGLLTP